MVELPPLGALAPDPDQAEIVAALLESVDRVGAGLDPLAIDQAGRLPEGLLSTLAELGLFGLTLPEAHGGFGLGLWPTASVIQRLAGFDRSVATTVGLHLGLGTRGLVRWGSPAQLARWVPDLASGRRIAAFATTEPDAGSDLTALRTLIRQDEASGELLVDGSKIYVTNGALADVFTISGRSPGMGGARRGQSVVVLEKEDLGLVVGAEEKKLGLRGSSTTTLSLDGMRVPADRLLGPAGQGPMVLSHVLAWGRTVMAGGCCGTGAAALAATRRHCGVRVQFGRPLSALPVVQDQLEQAEAILFGMEAVVRYASWQEEQLESRSLAAKVFCSEGSWELADLAVQLHGGAGYIEETGVALMLRDARITRIFEGANDVLRIHMGLFESALPARTPLAPLGELGQRADRLAAQVRARAETLRTTLGVRLGGAQVLLHGLGGLVLLRTCADAAVLRACSEGTPQAESLADRFLVLAHRRALPLLDAPVEKPASRLEIAS